MKLIAAGTTALVIIVLGSGVTRAQTGTSAPAASSTSTCRKIFRQSSSEYRFRAMPNPPNGITIVAQF